MTLTDRQSITTLSPREMAQDRAALDTVGSATKHQAEMT